MSFTLRLLSNTLLLLSGSKRAWLAIGLGVLAAFSLPPFGLFPVLFISFTGFYWLLQGAGSEKPYRTAAFIAWCFGFGYHVNGLWWISSSLFVEPDKFAIFLPLAILGLPAGLALFSALGGVLYAALKNTFIGAFLSFAIAFMAVEVARGHIITGFPWNLYGYALTQFAPLAQSASVVGVYGLTFIALLLFITPALGRKAFLTSLATLVLMSGYGFWRLKNNPTTYHEKIALRLVQPNIAQEEGMRVENMEALLKGFLTLSDKARSQKHTGLSEVTHLIWPESPLPSFIAEDPKALAQISALLPQNTLLLTGALRRDTPLPGKMRSRVYNSLFVINAKGEIVHSYDKAHLVPFGEYLPFQETLEKMGLQQLTRLIGGFSAGQTRKLLELPHTPSFSPLICYEIIFPSEVMPPQSRAQWILNLTNDAWFGVTPGPYQHFHMAQVRAIEEGVPVVRVANNGISGVIDSLGRVTTSLNLTQRDVLDSRLPLSISQPIYTFLGKYSIVLLILLSLIIKLIWFLLPSIKLKNQS